MRDRPLAALEKPLSVAGGSQLQPWLVSVLRYAVISRLGRHGREATVRTTDDGDGLAGSLFDANRGG